MDASQWNWFLTPSTTPTDPTFSPAALQAPRIDSHFQDAFSPFQQQQNAMSGTPFTSMEQFHESMFGHNGMSPRFSSDVSRSAQQQHTEQFESMSGHPIEFSQPPKHTGAATFQAIRQPIAVHTPPSARAPSDKRRAPRPHSIMFGTPTSMDQLIGGQAPALVDHSLRAMLPPSSNQPLMPVSMDLSQAGLQMQAPNVSAPEGAMWNMSNGMAVEQRPMQPGALADPFTYQAQQMELANQSFQSDDSHYLASTSQLFSPAQQTHLHQAPILPSNAHATGPAVTSPEQSNVYQSPSRMGPPAAPQVPASSYEPRQHPADSLSPENVPQVAFPSPAAKLAVSQLSLRSDHDSQRPPSSGGLKPGLRRSNTVETRRPHSMYGSIESLNRSNTMGIQRKGSPLKRNNRNSTTSLASILEGTPNMPRSRTSIVLTVDSKGRARTETRTVDTSPTRAFKTRYPSLWDDSDSETDSDETTTSKTPARSEDRRRAKLDAALESLEGLHLPRSNSSTSIRVTPSKAAISAAVQLRRQSSVKKPYAHSRRNTMASTGSFIDKDAMDISSDEDTANGDAGAALRKAMERRDQHREQASARLQARSRPQSQAGRPTSSSFPPRASSMANLHATQSFEHALSHHHHHHHHHRTQIPSPVKPTGAFADSMSSITRCICNLPIAEGQLMIQCNACQFWLHTACLGIPPNNIPPTYFCTFCMAPPPPGTRLGWETAAAF